MPILVVEDDLDIRETIREILEYDGFDVEVAGTCNEALARLKVSYRPAVMLVDYWLPDGTAADPSRRTGRIRTFVSSPP